MTKDNDIELTNMTAQELDKLIIDASQLRANMEPPVPIEHLKAAEAIVGPAWYTEAMEIGALFQIRHPGLGWIAFIIPHAERAHLLSVLLHQSLTFNNNGNKDIRPVTNIKGGIH